MSGLTFLALLLLTQPELRPIDAGTEDVSLNSKSRLVPRVDQRKPSGFDQVYELTKPDGSRVFVRISGDVYAEFDRSVYTSSGPDIAPGTVFRFGSPNSEAESEIPPSPNRVDLSASGAGLPAPGTGTGAVGRGGDSTALARAVGEASIISNELYRQVRVSQLLFGTLKRSDH